MTQHSQAPWEVSRRTADSPENTIFVSCSSEDVRSARHIRDALEARGFKVWMARDKFTLNQPNEEVVRQRVQHCGLFIAIISRNASRQPEIALRLEWSWAIERLHKAPDCFSNFILPVVIDDTNYPEAILPEEFKRLHPVRLPENLLTPEFWEAVEKTGFTRSETTSPAAPESTQFRDGSLLSSTPYPSEPVPLANSPVVSESVTFSAFAPPAVCPGQAFILDVWAHAIGQIDLVLAEAEALGRDRKLGVKAGIEVARGTVIGFVLEILTLQVSDPVESLVWNGNPANASFVVNVPPDARPGVHPARVIVTASGIPVTKLSFLIQVGPADTPRPEQVKLTAKPTRTAFASYSSRDRAEVLARVQGMTKARPDLDVFLDVLSLRSGQDWEVQLQQHIPGQDVFFLFWSQHARQSKEVEAEWKLALKLRGISYIDPVPLCDPKDAPPPPELQSLHFNDLYLSYINAVARSARPSITTKTTKRRWKLW